MLLIASAVGMVIDLVGLIINVLMSGNYSAGGLKFSFTCGWNYVSITYEGDTDTEYGNYTAGSAYCGWCATAIAVSILIIIYQFIRLPVFTIAKYKFEVFEMQIVPKLIH